MKYLGSKNKIAKEIVDVIFQHSNIIPNETNLNFCDAFCGGLHIIQEVANRFDYNMGVSLKAIALDKNIYLMSMFDYIIRFGFDYFPTIIPKELYDGYKRIYNLREKEYGKTDYSLPLKTIYEDLHTNALIGWVGFMASYNGKFYSGGYSGHNVKISNGYRDYITE